MPPVVRDTVSRWAGPSVTVLLAIISAIYVSAWAMHSLDNRVAILEQSDAEQRKLQGRIETSDNRITVIEQTALRQKDFQDRVLDWQRKTDSCIENIKDQLVAIRLAIARHDEAGSRQEKP